MADWAHLALTRRRHPSPRLQGPAHARGPQLHVGHLHRGRVRRRERGVRGGRGDHGRSEAPGDRALLRQPRVALPGVRREPRHPGLRARDAAWPPPPASPARQPARPELHGLHADLRADRRRAVPRGREELLGHARAPPDVLARRRGRELPRLEQQHRAVAEPGQHRQRDRRGRRGDLHDLQRDQAGPQPVLPRSRPEVHGLRRARRCSTRSPARARTARARRTRR